MVEEVPDFPTLNSMGMSMVNNRIHNYSRDPYSDLYIYELAVTQEDPIVDGN